MTHDELRDLLGAFALDAVDEGERRAIEAHLGECDACRREVGEHREVAGLLVAVDQPAPPEVWDRIRERMGDGSGRPVSLEARRQPRFSRAAAALGAAAVLIAGVLGWRVYDLERRLDDGGGLAGAAQEALADPDAVRLAMRSTTGDVEVDAVVLPDGRGYLVDDNLDALPGDRTYQLWALAGGEAVSAGLLGPDPGVSAFRVGAGTDALAITVEASVGAVAPTGDPIAAAQLA